MAQDIADKDMKNILDQLFLACTGEKTEKIEVLPPSASYRSYFRLIGKNNRLLGAYNEEEEENVAFITYTNHFYEKDLPVPRMHAVSPDRKIYLLEDLGDLTLYKYLEQNKNDLKEEEIIQLYQKVLDNLLRFQLEGGEGMDYSVAFPRPDFDRQSIMWDLNYFKYYFVKLFKATFHEQRLENDFHVLTDFLLNTDCSHFMFRDFQSRNIMMIDEKLYFIDYQGGRRGALQYDVASLLFEAKTALPFNIKEELLNYYITQLSQKQKVDSGEFEKIYYGYVLVRMMQAMGAYGFRGVVEGKKLFIDSIPPALKQLHWLMPRLEVLESLYELTQVFNQLINSEEIRKIIINY